MDLLNEIAKAAHLLDKAVAKLNQALIEPATPEDERSQISLSLPRVRLRRRELDAEFDALCALGKNMTPPSDDVVQRIRTATATLAELAVKAQTAQLLLTTATALVNAVRAARDAQA